MRNTRKFVPIVALFLMFVDGCKKEVSSGGEASLLKQPGVAASTTSAAAFKEAVGQLRAALPDGFAKQLQANYVKQVNTTYRNRILRILKVTEYSPCNNNTAITQWMNAQLANWTDGDKIFASSYQLFDLPTYYAWFYENNASLQSFGMNGEYTQVINKTFKSLQRFWNIETSNMMVAAMHGNILVDAGKISSTLQVLYGYDKATSDNYGYYLSVSVLNNPVYRAGNHPVFTYNAVSVSTTTNLPVVGTVFNKIVMGDGVLDAFKAQGYDDVAPQAILAHEFGHQIQFQKNLVGPVSSPEATLRLELMADAFSAYFLSSSRGAAMKWKRVQQFLQVFFNIGDCSVDDANHHGTPTQRMAAANWAYNLAISASKQGGVLKGEEFAALFDAQLSQILSQ